MMPSTKTVWRPPTSKTRGDRKVSSAGDAFNNDRVESVTKVVQQARKRKLQKDSKSQKEQKSRNTQQKVVTKSGHILVAQFAGNDSEEIYYFEIEEIIGRRINKGRVEYLCRWKNCPESENTWEPSANLCDSAFQSALEFDRKQLEKELWRSDGEKLSLLNGNEVEKERRVSLYNGCGSRIEPHSRPKITREKCEDDGIEQKATCVGDRNLSGQNHCHRGVELTTTKKVASQGEKANGENTCSPPAPHPHGNDSECSDPDDVESQWTWDEKEQVRFQEIERIDVSCVGSSTTEGKKIHERVRQARLNGVPLVLTGHTGWAQFAARWLKKRGDTGGGLGTCRIDESMFTDWLDLSDRSLKLDVDAMIEDIGEEDVPIVRRNYNESSPIHGVIQASKFLQKSWIEGNKKLYLHQWQFPLSQTAGRKLCFQNRALAVFGEDLLKYWVDLDQCKGDSPLQYIFMGREETFSKLHRDNGGLAISIAPIVGTKECVLVHRNDAACLYQLNASLEDPDLHRYPLLVHARIWRSAIVPGEILLMPEGTFHQCRNLTPCLSYSRFHLDEVNLPAFVRSMFDKDAPEIEHDEILWNAAYELIQQIDGIVDNAQLSVKKGLSVSTLTKDQVRIVETLRILRHSARDVARRIDIRSTVTGEQSLTNSVRGCRRVDRAPSNVWECLVDDIDLCLHEFRHRRLKKPPSFRVRRLRQNLENALTLPGDRHLAEKKLFTVAYDTRLERAYLSLPDIVWHRNSVHVPRGSFDDLSVGEVIEVRIVNKKVKAEVTEVVPHMHAAYVSYEEHPSIYDEYRPLDKLRSRDKEEVCDPEELKPGMIVLDRSGPNNEEYRAVVKFVTSETMLKVRYLGLMSENGSDLLRWIPLTDVLHRVSQNKNKESKSKVMDLVVLQTNSVQNAVQQGGQGEVDGLIRKSSIIKNGTNDVLL